MKRGLIVRSFNRSLSFSLSLSLPLSTRTYPIANRERSKMIQQSGAERGERRSSKREEKERRSVLFVVWLDERRKREK
jgi:hypothetical protein